MMAKNQIEAFTINEYVHRVLRSNQTQQRPGRPSSVKAMFRKVHSRHEIRNKSSALFRVNLTNYSGLDGKLTIELKCYIHDLKINWSGAYHRWCLIFDLMAQGTYRGAAYEKNVLKLTTEND